VPAAVSTIGAEDRTEIRQPSAKSGAVSRPASFLQVDPLASTTVTESPRNERLGNKGHREG
jgi:hypothetical protein